MRTFITILITAVVSSALTLLVTSAAVTAPAAKVVLENARVRVSELVSPPGAVRPKGERATAQVIVFLDDCRYERLDPATGEKTVRARKAGEVIWHERGEAAPQLTNVGTTAYRQILIELK